MDMSIAGSLEIFCRFGGKWEIPETLQTNNSHKIKTKSNSADKISTIQHLYHYPVLLPVGKGCDALCVKAAQCQHLFSSGHQSPASFAS